MAFVFMNIYLLITVVNVLHDFFLQYFTHLSEHSSLFRVTCVGLQSVVSARGLVQCT